MDKSRSRFVLFLALGNTEELCLQRYVVENSNIFIAFPVIIGYSVLIKVQNWKFIIF